MVLGGLGGLRWYWVVYGGIGRSEVVLGGIDGLRCYWVV